MNDLDVCQKAGPPATVEELTQFLLIAPERVTSMRAEIRAIKKAGLAAEVYLQKVREQQQLCELILDASVRMGEIAKSIPKAGGGDRRSDDFKMCNAGHFEKSKKDTIENLGFSQSQIQRFETLANNKDLVEQEKAQAREEARMPTRTNVINLAQERKKRMELQREQIDRDFDNLKLFRKAISISKILEVTDEVIDSVAAVDTRLGDTIQDLNDLIGAIIDIREKLIQKGAEHGKKQRD